MGAAPGANPSATNIGSLPRSDTCRPVPPSGPTIVVSPVPWSVYSIPLCGSGVPCNRPLSACNTSRRSVATSTSASNNSGCSPLGFLSRKDICKSRISLSSSDILPSLPCEGAATLEAISWVKLSSSLAKASAISTPKASARSLNADPPFVPGSLGIRLPASALLSARLVAIYLKKEPVVNSLI